MARSVQSVAKAIGEADEGGQKSTGGNVIRKRRNSFPGLRVKIQNSRFRGWFDSKSHECCDLKFRTRVPCTLCLFLKSKKSMWFLTFQPVAVEGKKKKSPQVSQFRRDRACKNSHIRGGVWTVSQNITLCKEEEIVFFTGPANVR